MKNKKVYLSIAVVIMASLLFILAGCGQSASPSTTTTPDLTADEIVSASLSAAETITTFKADMDFNITIQTTGGDQPENISLQQQGSSSFDVSAKKMSTMMDITVDIPDQGKQELSSEVYIADGWVYSKVGIPVIGEQWFKTEISEEEWNKKSELSKMSEFLKSAVDVELTGSESVNGVDCYVLTMTPDTSAIADWVNESLIGQQTGVDLSNFDFAKAFKNIVVKEWISKESKLVMQGQIIILAEITPADFTTTEANIDKLTVDINGMITLYDYGQPVDIVVPPEAADAQELPAGNSVNNN